MQVTVLGCSGTFPGPDSPCSSYLVEHEGFRLLVDAGNGSTGNLQRCGHLLNVDAVLVSHLHGDHYLDLLTYTYARRYHPAGRAPQLAVYGPAATREHVGASFGGSSREVVDEVYDFRPVTPGKLELGPFRLELDRVNHPLETYAVRITAGDRSLAYSADTGVCDELVGIARDADVFLCEASYLDGEDNPPDIHLTGRQAGEHAARAGVGRLILTHLVPWGDARSTLAAAHETYDGDVSLASTYLTFEI